MTEARTPTAIDAEMALIGSVTIDADDTFDVASQAVRVDDFQLMKHQRIWTALLEMRRAREPINDVVILARRLHAAGHLDLSGDCDGEKIPKTYIDDCQSCVVLSAHWDHYAGAVRDASDRRKLIAAMTDGIVSANDQMREPSDIICETEQRLHTLLDRHASASVATADQLAKELEEDLYEETDPGIPTGFPGLDTITSGGLRPGWMVVPAARTSIGKTAVAANIALHVARQGRSVLFLALEQARLELSQRIASLISGVPATAIQQRDIPGDQQQRYADALHEFAGLRLAIEDAGRRNAGHIASTARLHQRRHGLDLLVVDYLQLIEPDDRKVHREQQVATASRAMKLLAKELGVPVLLLAQLNRGVEHRDNKRPRLSDLRESGAIEQDSDIVFFVDRPHESGNSQDEHEAYLIVAKNRHGRCGDIRLHWEGRTMQFSERIRI